MSYYKNTWKFVFFFLALIKSFIDSIVLVLSENKFKIFTAW